MIDLSRRRFLFTAPAIVAVSSIMPISMAWMPGVDLIHYGAGKSLGERSEVLGLLGTSVRMGDGTQHRITRIITSVYTGRDFGESEVLRDFVATLKDRTWREEAFAATRALSRIRKSSDMRLVSGLRRNETTHAPWPMAPQVLEGQEIPYIAGRTDA